MINLRLEQNRVLAKFITFWRFQSDLFLAKKLTWLTYYLKRQSITAEQKSGIHINDFTVLPMAGFWLEMSLCGPEETISLQACHSAPWGPTPAKAPSTLWLHGFPPLCKDSWQVFPLQRLLKLPALKAPWAPRGPQQIVTPWNWAAPQCLGGGVPPKHLCGRRQGPEAGMWVSGDQE